MFVAFDYELTTSVDHLLDWMYMKLDQYPVCVYSLASIGQKLYQWSYFNACPTSPQSTTHSHTHKQFPEHPYGDLIDKLVLYRHDSDSILVPFEQDDPVTDGMIVEVILKGECLN